MDSKLRQQFDSALKLARDSHASNISRDLLGTFVRAVKIEPQEAGQLVDLLKGHIDAHPSNTKAALYCLIRLADASDEAKVIIKDKLGADFIAFYAGDEDSAVSGNAIILGQVLDGEPLSKFQRREDSSSHQPHSVTYYNLNNSNLAINSPNASQTIKMADLSDDLKEKISELQEAINKKDKVSIGKIFAYIADKSVDVAIALLTQKLVSGS